MIAGEALEEPKEAAQLFKTKLGLKEHEEFAVAWLDNRHRLICFEVLFTGSINGSSVYPREVVKRGLALNAGAAIIGHNHPSGVTTPSQADLRITGRLKDALELVEIRLLDHLIVAGNEHVSLAERGQV
ncbi:MAG: DNA repair protein RadC [Parasphingorhabdus sp.]